MKNRKKTLKLIKLVWEILVFILLISLFSWRNSLRFSFTFLFRLATFPTEYFHLSIFSCLLIFFLLLIHHLESFGLKMVGFIHLFISFLFYFCLTNSTFRLFSIKFHFYFIFFSLIRKIWLFLIFIFHINFLFLLFLLLLSFLILNNFTDITVFHVFLYIFFLFFVMYEQLFNVLIYCCLFQYFMFYCFHISLKIYSFK